MNIKSQILRSPDAASGAQEVDPLSGAASGWEAPKYPVLAPDRICRFEVKKASVGPTKDHQDRSLLTMELRTTKDYTDKEGKPLRAGFPVYHRIGLTPVEPVEGKRGRDWKMIGADLAMVLKACGKEFSDKHEPKDLRDNPSILEGQVVDCKVGLNKEANGFPESNRVTFVLPG